MSDEGKPAVTAREVAKVLGVGVSTVYEWAKAGKVPAVRISGTVRFSREWLERMFTEPRQDTP